MLSVPKWQVVAVCVGVVQEAALLDAEPPGVNVGLALVEPHGPLPEHGLVDLYRLSNVLLAVR